MTERDKKRLAGVHQDLVSVVAEVLAQMEADGTPMFVVEGVRTVTRQSDLWRQGRDERGRIVGRVVTYKDGVVHRSNHQPRADGYGYAVDCAFSGEQPFHRGHPWHVYGERLEALGVRWGGRWAMADLPHAELDERKGLEPRKA